MLYYNVIRTKYNGKENKNFKLARPCGTNNYLFLHFKTPVIFTLFNKTRRVSPGECILLSPKTAHSFYPDSCDLVHDWMHFVPSDENEFLNLKIDINSFFTPLETGFISSSIKKCEHELIYKDEFYEELVSSEVTSIFIKLKRQLGQKTFGHHADALRVLRLDMYQNPNCYESTLDMANSIDLSRSRFTVVYKELFGVSPKNDLISARISKASYLLSLGTLSLVEISEACGYQSIYHFIRQFRTVVGTTPGAYRKNY